MKLFKELKQEKLKKNDINVLLATRELESFATKYGKVHYKVNESSVITKHHYGKSMAVLLGYSAKNWTTFTLGLHWLAFSSFL